jgi:hypothetical protein
MDPKHRSFDPGSACKDGKLYLFTDKGVLVVRPWPDPRAWRLDLEGPWMGARPLGLNLAAPDQLRSSSSLELRNQARAFAAIPRDRRRAAARFGERAWPMHVLFTRVPGALALAERCPALALGLAFANKLRPPVRQPLRSARALLRDPGPATARRVAGWLGFEPSRATVRVLGRLHPRDCSVGTLRLLRAGLEDPTMRKVLLHAPVLGKPLLGLLWDLAEPEHGLRLGSALLSAIAHADAEQGWHLLGCIGFLRANWFELWPDRPRPRLVSAPQLLRLHDLAFERYTSPVQLRALSTSLGGFPLPPRPAGMVRGVHVEPLLSVDDLIREGEIMDHCVGSREFVRDCALRRGYGYRVTGLGCGPSVLDTRRATAWLDLRGPDTWSLGQLRGPGNEMVPAELRAAVEAWLAQDPDELGPRRPFVPDAARGHTLRVVRHRRPAPPPRRPQPPRPPPPQGWQVPMDFEIPF